MRVDALLPCMALYNFEIAKFWLARALSFVQCERRQIYTKSDRPQLPFSIHSRPAFSAASAE